MLWKFNYKVDDGYYYTDHTCIIIAETFKEAKEYFYNYVNKECLRYDEFLVEESIIVKEIDTGNHIIYAD